LTESRGDPSQDRLPPIAEHLLTPKQRAVATALIATRRGALRGPFVPLLYSPELLDRAQRLGEYLRYESALPERLRELAILITARHWSQVYEWHVHAPLAEKTGLDRQVIDELAAGRRPGQMRGDEAAVYDFCMELHRDHIVSDTIYAAALAVLAEQGIVDLCGICGYYSMLAMVMNAARTALPRDASSPWR
jgi:4-carboxymuconolactone decarboxylase